MSEDKENRSDQMLRSSDFNLSSLVTNDKLDMNKYSLGQNLEKLLKEKNISPTKFAKKIQVSPKTLHEWIGKNGRFPSKAEHLKSIARELDISIHELIFGEPDPKEVIFSLMESTTIFTGDFEITIKRKIKKK